MTVYTAAITLFLVMDPIGNIPVFLSILAHFDARRRRRIIVREMLIALVILLLFLFFGKYILQAMHIQEHALGIGGGVVLFLIAIRMIFPRQREDVRDHKDEEPLIVPLAVPLIAGPSSMATVILFSSQYPGRIWLWLIALLASWLASACVLISSDAIRRRLGNRFLTAIERLMGMILTTLAIQMLLTGIKDFVHSF
ncbi:MAG: YhgN family NAAT transporter [Spirochaetaceae bacterium]|nr:MAG: YhgN family NAAT transporter [Spirochaetaceae bacterium]